MIGLGRLSLLTGGRSIDWGKVGSHSVNSFEKRFLLCLFPNVNDKVEHSARKLEFKKFLKGYFTVLKPWMLGFLTTMAVILAVWFS
jgi:hypothetical protein